MNDLYAERGGTEICIPIECDADHWMTRLFGEEKANAICSHFRVVNADGHLVGNFRCYIPSVNNRLIALQEQIEHEVREALIAGKSAVDICREVGVSERYVRGVSKVLREAGIIRKPEIARVRNASNTRRSCSAAKRRARADKTARVDELLIARRTTRAIMIEVGVGASSIRARRRRLSESGRLPTGEVVS